MCGRGASSGPSTAPAMRSEPFGPSTAGHMRAVLTERFSRELIAAPPRIHKLFGKQLTHLLRNYLHPSLRTNKYDEAGDIWQARFNNDWQFYFTIEGDSCVLRGIRPHPK